MFPFSLHYLLYKVYITKPNTYNEIYILGNNLGSKMKIFGSAVFDFGYSIFFPVSIKNV